MTQLYVMGDALLTGKELNQHAPELSAVKEALEQGRKEKVSVDLPTGTVSTDNCITHYTVATGERVPFEPIGIGKPLTIEIRHVYTGRYPGTTWRQYYDWPRGRKQDMIITSAVKGMALVPAERRMLNFLKKGVDAKSTIRNPAATDPGTPLVRYTPALIERNLFLTLEMGFDEFKEELFTTVLRAFQQAGSIPLFLAYNSYLLTASTIMKIVGDVGHQLFEKGPVFNATTSLSFLRPGEIPSVADFRLIVDDDVDVTQLQGDYAVDEDGILKDKASKNPYDGDLPYMVISLDGRENEEYENFVPTAASAELLESFFALHDGQPTPPLEPLFDALKLYNDWKFRKKAEEVCQELKELDPQSEEYKKKKSEFDALVANILTNALKPKCP